MSILSPAWVTKGEAIMATIKTQRIIGETDWEANTFAGLEQLDDEGRARVSLLGSLAHEPDEPEMVASGLPVFEELDIDVAFRLA